MARRRFLPALRQAYTQTEQKAFSIGGFASVLPRVQTYGMRDSAAGWDMEQVVTDGYERVVWVFKAVEVIAGNASRLPFRITTDENDEVESHPLLRVMNKRANPLETGRMFRKRLSAQILLSKRGAFVEVTKSRAGQITRLDLLPPDRVRIVPDQAGDYVEYFEFMRYDGEVRNLSPERVRWIREPHPLDPFSGITPLEAAGMSVELDRLARAYNVSFITRDGRPGGILGVDTDGIEDEELDRIERRLQPGPYAAGSITAIGTGKGGINYVDTSSKPRDMAYETTSDKAKKEILGAFGVPESMAGDASGRTFDNAEQEEYNFWQDPMLPHLDLIAAAFDGDVDEELDCGFDTSGVEALELPARRRREEARTEFDKGLRSVDEYREITDDLEPLENPQSRAVWISPAKAPVPGRPEDAEALGLSQPGGGSMPPGAMPPGGPGAPAPTGEHAHPDAETAHAVVEHALAAGDHGEDPAQAAAMAPEHGDAAAAVDQARAEGHEVEDSEAAAAVEQARIEGKSLVINDNPAPEPKQPQTYDPGDDELHRVELAVSAALDALLARQAGVVTARLESPKMRRGTRYWAPENESDTRAGDEPINSARVVDKERWAGETQETLKPIAQPAAQDSAKSLLAAMIASGVVTAPLGASAVVAGRIATAPAPTDADVAQATAKAAVAPLMLALTIAETAMRDWLDERAADIDRMMVEEQLPLPDLVEAVKKMWAEKSRPFANSLAVTVAQTAVEGGREGAADQLKPQVSAPPAGSGDMLVETPAYIDRIWQTREDERVRETHREADGQVRMLGDMFDVGGFPLRYPSDPLGPPSVTRYCRCWLRYEWPHGAKFTLGEAK